jgi:hypothetical protein
MAALKLMIPDDQVGIAGVDALKLVITDDQVGIAVDALSLKSQMTRKALQLMP